MSGQTDRDLSAASLSMLYVRVVFFLTVVTAFHSASYEYMIMLLKVMYSRKIANETTVQKGSKCQTSLCLPCPSAAAS